MDRRENTVAILIVQKSRYNTIDRGTYNPTRVNRSYARLSWETSKPNRHVRGARASFVEVVTGATTRYAPRVRRWKITVDKQTQWARRDKEKKTLSLYSRQLRRAYPSRRDIVRCALRFPKRGKERESERERERERERVRPRWGEGEDAFAAWRDSRAPAWPGDVISEPGSSSSSTRHSVSPRPFEEIVHVKFLLAISPILCHSESQLSRKFRDTRDRRIDIGPDLSGCCLLTVD